MASNGFTTAMTNRSIRTIKAELEFLTSVDALSHDQLAAVLQSLPSETIIGTPGSNQPPTSHMASLSVSNATSGDEKRGEYYAPSPAPPAQAQPPAYPGNGPPPLTYATALYAYNPQDAGDLALAPNDRIAVTEYMNAEWWKGRSERTGQSGIFPRSYVRAEEKYPTSPPVQPTNYGNMPLDVAQGGSGHGQPDQPNKVQEGGKKFGKKLGNAAIFGAGATIGSNIVNSIF